MRAQADNKKMVELTFLLPTWKHELYQPQKRGKQWPSNQMWQEVSQEDSKLSRTVFDICIYIHCF